MQVPTLVGGGRGGGGAKGQWGVGECPHLVEASPIHQKVVVQLLVREHI